ncbi:MAG: serine/threonine protein kinase [Myxococcota bacterium]|jgi:serine/threonine protein kinase
MRAHRAGVASRPEGLAPPKNKTPSNRRNAAAGRNDDHGRLTLIAQEYLSRGAVTSEVNSERFLPLPRALGVVTGVLRGLEQLHHQGIVHNDIKPSNILIRDDGRAALTDYGISTAVPAGGAGMAPNRYIIHSAPETDSSNSVSAHADIYQLGLTFFRLITDIHALHSDFDRVGQDDYLAFKRRGEILSLTGFLPLVPRSVRAVVTKATKLDILDRFQSALEMRRAVERLQFPGYWDVDVDGSWIGYGERYTYAFTETAQPGGRVKFEATRTSRESGVTRRIRDFCATGDEDDAYKLRGEYLLWVVETAR